MRSKCKSNMRVQRRDKKRGIDRSAYSATQGRSRAATKETIAEVNLGTSKTIEGRGFGSGHVRDCSCVLGWDCASVLKGRDIVMRLILSCVV